MPTPPVPQPPVHLKTTASCGVLCAADIPTRIHGHAIQYVHNNKMKTHVYAFVHGQILQLQKKNMWKNSEYSQYSLPVSLTGVEKRRGFKKQRRGKN